jgi:hypothetical protein
MTRDELVRAVATDLKIRARIFALKRLAWASASAFEKADATLHRELRAMIDGDKANDVSYD